MASKVVKLGLLLLCALYSSSQQLRPISQVAQAFLFHQLPPASYSPSGLRENFSVAPAVRSSSYLSNSKYPQHSRQGTSPQITTRDLSNFEDTEDKPIEASCPTECHCDRVAQTVDCSNRNLHRIPAGFPHDTKRIRLERNNITELGPYAFQGLKRLQRIDLSNNNLQKIDPLAFAGGLPSLISLILYSNKLNHLPANLFSDLGQLQLLLLNANSLQCIHKELFQPLTNLNLLSLFDNDIETLANGTFDGLKNIKTIHLGKNPLVCDCNLRWLADYLELNPVETSEARCEGPTRNQGKKLSQLNKQRFKCEGNEQSKTNQIASQCAAPTVTDQSCPDGCVCTGATVDCSRASLSESRSGGGIYELPDIPDDVPVYVTHMRVNDRIKRIRQTGLFNRLVNSQKLDLGGNKIIDIEDNAINGAGGSTKPERVVFVLLENNHCDAKSTVANSRQPEDACSLAPKVNAPTFDSACYNGGSCVSTSRSTAPGSNYSCLCPPGFAGPLCEINIDDCAEHQCQNGAMCVDGINSYKCVCRDPTTTGEFCEQLNSYSTSSANAIAPIALPMIAASSSVVSEQQQSPQQYQSQNPPQQQIQARSADFLRGGSVSDEPAAATCKRVTKRQYYEDGNGCQSVRLLKISECVGACGSPGCCQPAKVKRRRIRLQCSDGASYVKSIDLVKKCACSSECISDLNQQQNVLTSQFNATQEDKLLQITRLDAVD